MSRPVQQGNSLVIILMILTVAIGILIWHGQSEPPIAEELPLPTDKNIPETPLMEDGTLTTPPVDPSRRAEADQSFTTKDYVGTKLGGREAVLLDFNQADYETAIAANKIILLYFYANWCSICKSEFAKMVTAFDQLTSREIVGFRVNYNDNQTDSDEEALAAELGVSYQYTKVIVKAGKSVVKSPETWDTTRYVSELNGQVTTQ